MRALAFAKVVPASALAAASGVKPTFGDGLLNRISPNFGPKTVSAVLILVVPFSPKIFPPGLVFGLAGRIRVKGLGLKLVSTLARPPSGPIDIILIGELLIELETEGIDPLIGEAIRGAIEVVTALAVGIF